MAERMLFGPDNDDIIRSDGHGRTDTPHDQDYRSPTGGHYSAGGNPGRNQAMPSGVNPPFHPTQQAEMQPWRTGPEAQSQAGVHIDPQTTQPHVQESVYQSDKFTRSASIERIVVFYKDKTFSEYQPV